LLYHHHTSTSLFLLLFLSHATATTEIYTLSLHDALPILIGRHGLGLLRSSARATGRPARRRCLPLSAVHDLVHPRSSTAESGRRSEEHTSELQSRENLVCRLLLEKKKNKK